MLSSDAPSLIMSLHPPISVSASDWSRARASASDWLARDPLPPLAGLVSDLGPGYDGAGSGDTLSYYLQQNYKTTRYNFS